jgi:hypothetical protein
MHTQWKQKDATNKEKNKSKLKVIVEEKFFILLLMQHLTLVVTGLPFR